MAAKQFAGDAALWADLPQGYGNKSGDEKQPARLPTFTKKPQLCQVKRLYLTANPYGGKGKGSTYFDTVRKIFEDNGVQVLGQLTERPGHNTELVRSLNLDEYDAVVIIGGDGSLHEAVTGMMTREDNRQIPIGVIPGGTGNSFMCDLATDGKLVDVATAARAILDGLVARIDLAKVTLSDGQVLYACNIVDYPAEVLTTANKMRFLGNMMYKVAGVWHIASGQYGTHVTLTIDGEALDLDNVMVVHVQNSQHSGDQVCVAPYARLDDGLLDLMIIPSMGKGALLGILADVDNGKWVWRRDITHRRFRKLRLESRGDHRYRNRLKLGHFIEPMHQFSL